MDIIFSDEEVDTFKTEATWDTIKGKTLPFGSNQGKTYEEMLTTGKLRSYLRYLLRWDQLRPYTRSNIECALAEYHKLKDARTVPTLPTMEKQSQHVDAGSDTEELEETRGKVVKRKRRRKP